MEDLNYITSRRRTVETHLAFFLVVSIAIPAHSAWLSGLTNNIHESLTKIYKYTNKDQVDDILFDENKIDGNLFPRNVIIKSGKNILPLPLKYASISTMLSSVIDNAKKYEKDNTAIILSETKEFLDKGYFTWDLTSSKYDEPSIQVFVWLVPWIARVKDSVDRKDYKSMFSAFDEARREFYKKFPLEFMLFVNPFNFSRLLDHFGVDELSVKRLVQGCFLNAVPMEITGQHEGKHSSGSPLLSPDGKLVITNIKGGDYYEFRDAFSGALLHTIKHKWGRQANFSPDSKQVVTASYGDTAKLWSTSSGDLLRSLKHDGSVNSASFSPDGAWIITASSDKTAKIWDTYSGARLRTLQHDYVVNTASFSPDGERVVTTSFYTDEAIIWSASSGIRLHTLRHHNVRQASFSPNGKQVITSGDDHSVSFWEAFSGVLQHVLSSNSWYNVSTFSPDQMQLTTQGFVGEHPVVYLWGLSINPDQFIPAIWLEMAKKAKKKLIIQKKYNVIDLYGCLPLSMKKHYKDQIEIQ